MDVFGLVAVLQGEVLEEGVGWERGGEEVRGEELGWAWEDCGLGPGEEEWALVVAVVVAVVGWHLERRRRDWRWWWWW